MPRAKHRAEGFALMNAVQFGGGCLTHSAWEPRQPMALEFFPSGACKALSKQLASHEVPTSLPPGPASQY